MRNFIYCNYDFIQFLLVLILYYVIMPTPSRCGHCLCCGVQHVFNENAVAGGGVIDEDMGNCAHQFAVLDDGTAGHADVK